jgi:hypothetical protein
VRLEQNEVLMANQSSFTPEEWNALRETPHAVAAAVTIVGASGITGTLKEAYSIASTMMESQSSGNSLIRELSTRDQVKAASQALKDRLGTIANPTIDTVREMALESVRSSVAILQAKAGEDLAAYKSWLKHVATNVAESAKEGGFLGFGGERVSEKEREILAQLDVALGQIA